MPYPKARWATESSELATAEARSRPIVVHLSAGAKKRLGVSEARSLHQQLSEVLRGDPEARAAKIAQRQSPPIQW